MNPSGRDQNFEQKFVMSFDALLSPRELLREIKIKWDEEKDENGRKKCRENIVDFLKIFLTRRMDVFADDTELTSDFMKWSESISVTDLDHLKATGFKLFVKAQLEGNFTKYVSSIEKMLLEEDKEEAPTPLFTKPIEVLLNSLDIIDIFDMHPTEIARQITIQDAQSLQRIKPHHYLHQGWNKGKSEPVSHVIRRFNILSNWVGTVVVLADNADLRASVIKQFLLIAVEFHRLNNYNAILGIISGLTSTPVSRLLQTWNKLEHSAIKTFEKLQKIVSLENKFKELRDAQESVNGPCIPYLGIYLNDLIQIEEGNPDYVRETNIFNFEKYAMISEIILRIELIKKHRYKIQPIEVIQEYLKKVVVLNEDEIFDESVKREGKEDNEKIKAKMAKKVKF